MLTAIRTAAGNWLGRLVLTLIMGLLIVSFAIWGIGDIFRGGSTRTIASVGNAKISAEQFRTGFNEELRRIQQRARRAVTTEEARAFGLDRELLNRMIDEAVLNQKAADLGLALDLPAITKGIVEADTFKVGGVFDRNRFNDILQQNGLSEAAFLRQQSELMLRQQIANGLVGAFKGSEVLARAVHQYRDEERTLQVVVIPAEKAAEPPAPDDAALKAFHEERKGEFRTVETRKASVLATSSAQFAKDVAITEADIRAFYDRGVAQGRFGTPEKRRAYRILFDTEAEAKAASEQLAAGGAIEAILEARKLTVGDVDLGLKSRLEITDPAVRGVVFSLNANETSAPIKDAFGFVLIRVVAVDAAKALPYEGVKSLIDAEARNERIAADPGVKAKLDALHRKIEDQRIAGKSLGESAAAAGLEVISIAALDKQGQDAAGQKLSLPGGMDIVNAIFASDIGLDNEPIQQKDGGYIWIEVNGIEVAREKGFDEVKEEVRTRLVSDQRSKALGEQVTGFLKRIEEGAGLATISGELGIPVQTFAAIKRGAREAILGQGGVERAFAGNLGKVVSAIGPDGIGRMLILPVSASLLPYDVAADEKSGFAKQIAQGMSEDIFAQYVAALKKDIGVSINQSALTQALGSSN